jgi:YcxB-like protein
MTPPPIPPVIDAPRRTVRYSITRWDILRWQFYLLIRNRVLIVFGLIASLALVWNDLRTPEMSTRPVGFKVFYAGFFTGAMFCVVGFGTMAITSCMIMFKKYRGFLGDHELEIREDGLVERTDVNESVHRWAGFHKLVATGRYLYIYVTDNNVHIVPRRYFASEQEQRAFQDEIQRHISVA